MDHFRSSRSSSISSNRSSTPVSGTGSSSSRHTPDRHGIQSTIQQLADDQERVQKKTFTNWMNTYLSQHDHPIKVENLFEDIKSGVVLLSLLEVLTGEKLRMEKGAKMKRVHFVSNISSALQFLEKRKIKLVNINPSDIADGKPCIVLGLIWTIILYLQIEKMTVQSQSESTEETTHKKSPREGVKKAMLTWTANAITKPYGITVNDFGKSWRDGVAFNAMIHNIRPDLVNLEEIKSQSARVNLEYAFGTAEDKLGIPRLIDAEDVDVEKPDEKSIMTYVAQFLQAYPEIGEDPAVRKKKRGKHTPEAELQEYKELLKWMESAEETLQIVDQPLTDPESEYLTFMAFKVQYDASAKVYHSLRHRIKSKQAFQLGQANLTEMEEKWNSVQRRTHLWQLKLDRSLPGQLCTLGEWLYNAEEFLERRLDLSDDANKMIQKTQTLIIQHQEIFQELPSYKSFFTKVKSQGKYEGVNLPSAQMEHMNSRLNRVDILVPQQMSMLTFYNSKFELVIFLDETEDKSLVWSKKFATIKNLEKLFNDYQAFVIDGDVQKKYETMFSTTKHSSEVYLKTEVGKKNADRVKEFLENSEITWTKIFKSIEDSGKVLEDSLEYWKEHDSIRQHLQMWLLSAEKVMQKSPSEKKEFFQDLPEWEDRLKSYNEACFYLADVCEPMAIAQMNHEKERINHKFKDLVSKYNSFEDQLKGEANQAYKDGVTEIAVWLTNVKTQLTKTVPCTQQALQNYVSELDICNEEVTDIESKLKNTTRTGQSLAKISPKETVDQMLETLRNYAESFKSNRKSITEKLKYAKIVLPNLESFEHGLTSVNSWVDDGEELIVKHQIDGDFNKVENWLETHKEHFSQSQNQKSVLESKGKILQKITSNKPKLKNVDFTPPEQLLQTTADRFQSVTVASTKQEKHLEQVLLLWQTYCQKFQLLDDWIDQAQGMINDTDDDTPSLLKKHKTFFDANNGKQLYEEFQDAGHQLLKLVPDIDSTRIQNTLSTVDANMKEINKVAPVRKMHLEFQLEETNFFKSVDDAKTLLDQNKQKLANNDNVKDSLQKHKKYFSDPFYISTENNLKVMDEIAMKFLDISKGDNSLKKRCDSNCYQWDQLCTLIDGCHLELKQLPERWNKYNARLNDFNKDVNKMKQLIVEMQKESLSTEEYQTLYIQFQDMLKNMPSYEADSNWLIQNLNSLLEDEEGADGEKNKKELDAILKSFSELKPVVGQASSKSSVFSKCFQFRDHLDKKYLWLDETQRAIGEQMYVDGLEEAHTILQEHKVVMDKLGAEGVNIQADLTKGQQLVAEGNTPSFVAQKTEELQRKYKDTIKQAEVKYHKLKQSANDWEFYEQQKTQVLQDLKKAESELDKAPTGCGQELAQKDLQSKIELQRMIKNLKERLDEMRKINTQLCEGASKERQEPLQKEITVFDQKLGHVSERLAAKLAQLEGLIGTWSEYYSRLNNFESWLKQTEIDLSKLKDTTTDSPEKQLTNIEFLCHDVRENNITLENLEKDSKGLSQNFRSRETAALKSKLKTTRRQWQQLLTEADDCRTSFTGSVTHWQMYQTLHNQLSPWLITAQKYCTKPVRKCSSIEDAKKIYSEHQAFIQDYDKHSLMFEKLVSEAHQVSNQSEVASQVEDLQGKLTDIQSGTEDITKQIEEIHTAFLTLDNTTNKFQNVIQKYESKLSVVPIIKTVDISILKHELATTKVLNQEIKDQSPLLVKLNHQFEEVKPHATPKGVETLETQQNDITDSWNGITELSNDRHFKVSAAVEHSEKFLVNLENFEKWLKSNNQSLTSLGEIYADDVPTILEKFEIMSSESSKWEDVFDSLSADFKLFLSSCSEDEAAVLRERFNQMVTLYTRVNDNSVSRVKLCKNWITYSNLCKKSQGKLKQLELRLSSPSISESEIAEISKTVGNVTDELNGWGGSVQGLDSLMKSSQFVVKDRATLRSLHFATELQGIESMRSSIEMSVAEKGEKIGELNQLWTLYIEKKDWLVKRLKEIVQQVNAFQMTESTQDGIDKMIKNFEETQIEISRYNPKYEEVLNLGHKVVQNDISKNAEVQSVLTQVDELWETLQALLQEKHHYFHKIGNMWQQYTATRENILRILDAEHQMLNGKLCFNKPEDVREAIESRKTTEFELHANQLHLDSFNDKGMALLEELQNVPHFDYSAVKADIENLNHKWEATNETIIHQREKCEAQFCCWEQILSGRDEMKNWLVPLIKTFEDNLQNLDDTIGIRNKLQKYREELPYFIQVLEEGDQKISDLGELNGGIKMVALIKSQKEIRQQFEYAEKLALELEAKIGDFSSQYEALLALLKKETEWVTETKAQLLKCDDMTGTDDDILTRIAKLKTIKEELSVHKAQTKFLQDGVDKLKKNYQTPEAANLAKDVQIHVRKFESLSERAIKMEISLTECIQQHCDIGHQQLFDWITPFTDKLSWCAECSGDSHGTETKLKALMDILSTVPEEEERRKATITKMEKVSLVLPRGKQEELKNSRKKSGKLWNSTIQKMKEAQKELETAVALWKEYNKDYEIFSQWLKKAESKLRESSSLKPNLPSKQQHLEFLKNFLEDSLGQSGGFDSLKKKAEKLSKTTGDARTASYAGQVCERYATHIKSIKDQITKMEQCICEHEDYMKYHRLCSDWLKETAHKLKKYTNKKAKDDLHVKLQKINELANQKQNGCQLLNSAIEAGEKLYPNTSNDGQNVIRQEVHDLQNQWQSFIDTLGETQQKMELSSQQKSSFDESYASMSTWVKDTDAIVSVKPALKDTLQEKKADLKSAKTLYQDVRSHHTMVDSLASKGKNLDSPVVSESLEQVSANYTKLCMESKNRVTQFEEYVQQHVAFQETYQNCVDWMQGLKDKFTVCSDLHGDKQALQNKLGRLQELQGALNDGKEKLDAVVKEAEKTIPQTAAKGQTKIKSDLQTLTKDLENLKIDSSKSLQSVSQNVESLQSFDKDCEELSIWLKDVKGRFTNPQLKSTLQEKEDQVVELKELENEINSRKDEFDNLKTNIGQIKVNDKHSVTAGNQLFSKYKSLCKHVKDVVQSRSGYLQDHEHYQTHYSNAKQYVETLKKQLKTCSDVAGNKTDNEDKLKKIKKLIEDKDKHLDAIPEVCESAEKLYPNTAVEGREIIRSEVRTLKDDWENLSDNMDDIQRKIEGCLQQWHTFEESYEHFAKWLADMNIRLKDMELQALLPNKRAQLQNHRVLHQDILSRQHTLESVQDRTQSLIQSSTVADVHKPVANLQKNYDAVLTLSKNQLQHLEQAVRDHQMYQDTCRDFVDWLNMATEKLEIASDFSGDRLSLQNKLDRVKEYAGQIEKRKKQLQELTDLCKKVEQKTSEEGTVLLDQELKSVNSRWNSYAKQLDEVQYDMHNLLQQWIQIDSQMTDFSQWIKKCEDEVKHFELKSFLDEKRAQLNKLKEKREEIIQRQSTLDALTSEVQSMMQFVMDVRLGSQLSQLTTRYQNLVTLMKELIVKWEKYAEEHQLFEETKVEFLEWCMQMDKRLQPQLETMTDYKSVEQRKLNLQMIIAENDQGGQKLEVLISAGEKLFPDTAGKGRESIRQDMRTARESLDKLMALVAGAQHHVHTSLLHWSVFTDSQDEILGWITHLEAQLGTGVEKQNTLQEKKNQVQTFKLILEDITAHQRKVDNVLEKAEAIVQETNNPEVKNFITDLEKRFLKVTEETKSRLLKSEECVSEHQYFNNNLQNASDWLRHAKEKMNICVDNHGDRQSLDNKLERIQEIRNTFQEFESTLDKCKSSCEVALQTTASHGQQAMKQELDMLYLEWDDFKTKLTTHKDNLEQGLGHWDRYEDQFEKQQVWLKEMEKKSKDFKLVSTITAKGEQFGIYKELLTTLHKKEGQIEELNHIDLCQEIKSKEPEMDSLMDEAHALQQLTGENRAINCTSQLTARYTMLEGNLKNLAKKCSQNLEDHKYYQGKLAECEKWLEKSQAKFDAISGVGNCRADLESSLEKIQDLLQERDTGLLKLNSMVEAGEKVIPNSAPDGRENIRLEMRNTKQKWETFFEDLTASQRKFEVALLQWVSFEDNSTQIEKWLNRTESQIEGQLPLMTTLEEKKLQLQNYKVQFNDVQSYKYVIDCVGEKIQALMEGTSQTDLAKSTSKMKTRYKKLCEKLKKCQEKYTSIVNIHQEYSDEYNRCVEWLGSIKEKLSLCADVSGDKHAIQYRLDKIMDILATMEEGEPKIKNVIQLSEKVLPDTADPGKEVIVRERDALKDDWSAFVSTVAEVKTELETCKDQWEVFESKYENCSLLVKQLENKIKGTELKKSFDEKEDHLKMLKSQLEEMNQQRDSMDELSEVAQNLSRMTSDSHISSKVAQLKSKHQVAITNIKDSCRKWESYVSDHKKHLGHYKDCQDWITQMKDKIKLSQEPSGNKAGIQEKLHQIQSLMTTRDDGQYKLQTAMDSLQMVLPHTAVPGRQNLHKNLQTLQAEYDDLSTQMSSTCSILEDCLSQWMLYDNELEQLQQWLMESENQIETESKSQATLQEKKLSLERVTHVKLKLDSQKSTINSLVSSAKSLHQLSKDNHLLAESKAIKKRYEKLVKSAQQLQEKCEQQVANAQMYRQAYIDAAEWLTFTRQLVNENDEMQGDKSMLEVQLNHIQEAVENIKEGEEKIIDTCSKGEVVIQESAESGQQLVRDELDALKSDLKDLKSEVDQHQTKTKKLVKQWNEYENAYDQLYKWINNFEVTIKNHLQAKFHLADVDKQLTVTKKFLQEINGKQKAIDKLDQKAQQLQTIPSTRISSQVAQINTTYSTLLNTTKDLAKRTEKLSSDCKQFEKTYDSAQTWISSSTKKLSECSSVGGDKSAIQKQITKLQELVVTKEEGQLLTHTAITYGEPLKTSLSSQSRDEIQHKLDHCQQEWDQLVSNMAESKVLLESNLLQWSDFTDSSNQVNKWIADMEKRLKEDKQPKVDLIEMKAYLQKMKNTYQDIVSYSPIIESAVQQGQKLNTSQSSNEAMVDNSQMSTQYSVIKEKAQAQLTEAETQVGQYQNFHDSCEHFRTWLKSAKEGLTVCGDMNGDRSSIAIKSNRLKNQIEDSKIGKQLLDQTETASNVILPNIAPLGKTKCEREIKNLKQDYEDYDNQLSGVNSKLHKCIAQWDQFETDVQAFDSQLKGIESTLREDIQPKANLQEKNQLLTSYQEYSYKVSSHQSQLDNLSEQAQELLQTCGEAGVSYTITQLTTRFQTVINKTKDCMKNLEQSYYQHEMYDKCQSEFTTWLDDVGQRLNMISDTSGPKDKVSQRLSAISELQISKDNGHLKLQKLIEAADKVVPNTNTAGSQRIRQNCDTCKTNYDAFLSNLSQIKQKQENALTNWEQFEEAKEQMISWLQEIENRLKQSPVAKSDLAEKRSLLERFKVIHQELSSQKNNLKKLEVKSKSVNDDSSNKSMAEIKNLYDSLFSKSQEIVERLEEHVKNHSEYRQSYLSCLEWLSNTKRRLRQIDNVSGDLQAIQERQSMLKEFRSSLSTGGQLVENCSQLAECVCKNTASPGCTIIQQELNTLQDEWKTLTMAVDESEVNLNCSLSTWTDFENEYAIFSTWFEDLERKSKQLLDPKDNLTNKKKQLQEAEVLLDGMKRQKEILEKIQDLGEKAGQKSNDPRISHRLLKLSSQYHGLTTTLKNIIAKLKENVQEHEMFDSSYNNVMEWIGNCEKELSDLYDSTDGLSVQEKLRTLNVIVNGMDETVYKVNKVSDYAEKIQPATSPSGYKSVEENIAEMSSKWKQLNQSVTDCAFNLQNSQQKWQDYESIKESLETWLFELENLLTISPEMYGQISEKKAQLDKYRVILSDINSKEKPVTDLGRSLSQLDTLSADNGVAEDSYSEIKSRYDIIQKRCQTIINILEGSYQEHEEFQMAQQDFEQWLLQTSLHLTAQNVTDLSTLELTEQHMKDNKQMVEDIVQHGVMLNEVELKGESLVASNRGAPKLADNTRDQVKKLKDGYTNLLTSAKQNKESLDVSLDHWHNYRKELEESQKFLKQDLPAWKSEMSSHHADNLPEVQEQLTQVKEMWDTLSCMRQNMNFSLAQCQPAGAAAADQTDSVMSSALFKFSDDINHNLIGEMNQVENQLDSLRSEIQSWETIDKLKNELRTTLRNKKEEIRMLEQNPAKLPEEAAQMEIAKLKGLKNDIDEKKGSLKDLSDRYNRLTEHNPQLSDPIINAVQEDWDEVRSYVSNVLDEKEQGRKTRKVFQDQQDEIDEDLARYAQELEKIELEGSSEVQMDRITPTREKRCGYTQTPDPSARQPGRRARLGSDTEEDSDTGAYTSDPNTRSPSNCNGTRSLHSSWKKGGSMKESYGSGLFRPPSNLKLRNVLLESESEESGYGETNTMHASSFDMTLDNERDFDGFQSTRTLYSSNSEDNVFLQSTHSEQGATGGWTRDASCQTSCNVRTQTPKNFWFGSSLSTDTLANDLPANEMLSQQSLNHRKSLQTSQMSLHSTGAQTGNSLKGSKTNLLRSILLEVKNIRSDKGLDKEENMTEDDSDTNFSSPSTANGSILKEILNDVRIIRQSGAASDVATQTQSEQSTQTSFSNDSPLHNLRHEKLRNMLDEVRGPTTDGEPTLESRPSTAASGNLLSKQLRSASETSVFSCLPNVTSGNSSFARQSVTQGVQSDFSTVQANTLHAPQVSPGSIPPAPNNPDQTQVHSPYLAINTHPGSTAYGHQNNQNTMPTIPRRKITQDDLNHASKRLERLRNYQLPQSRFRQFIPPQNPIPPPNPIPPMSFMQVPKPSQVPVQQNPLPFVSTLQNMTPQTPQYQTPITQPVPQPQYTVSHSNGYPQYISAPQVPQNLSQRYSPNYEPTSVFYPPTTRIPNENIYTQPPPPRRPRRSYLRFYDDMDIRRVEPREWDYIPRSQDIRTQILDRYHLDEVLDTASRTSQQLKKLTEKMKNCLKEEILNY